VADSEITYEVIFDGNILEGFNRRTVRASFGRGSGIAAERLREIFSTPGTVLKSRIAEEEARQFQSALRRIGMATEVRVASPPTLTAAASATAARNFSAGGAAAAWERAAAEAADAEPRTLSFEFRGDGAEYFKIWIVNLLLTIATLGIYSAWAKVRSRRYFYGNTRLDASSFEYLADPVAILKGRLIAAAFFIALALSDRFAPLLGIALSLVLIALMPWIVVRALAFRAHNSAYRNVRFGFSAHPADAAKAFLLWPLAGVLTLGILMPLAVHRQKQFIAEHTSFGTSRFAFHAEPREFYAVFLHTVGILIGGGVALALLGGILPLLALPAMLALYLFVFAFFSARMRNVVYNNTTLADHGLGADYEVASFAKLYLVNGIAMVLTLGLFYPWAKVRNARYAAEHTHFIAAADLDGFLADTGRQVRATGEEVGEMLGVDLGF
jgi:uncharacterized membrane protein YjgN (DUF898 family)